MLLLCASIREKQSMIIVRAESSVAFRAFTMSRLVSRTKAFPTEYVKTLSQYSVLSTYFARLTSQYFFVFAYLFDEHDIRRVWSFNFFHLFHFFTQNGNFLLKRKTKMEHVKVQAFNQCVIVFHKKKEEILPASDYA